MEIFSDSIDIITSDDDSLSDDDEDVLQYISLHYDVRKINERSNLFNSLRDDEFIKRFRLSKQSVTLLLNQIIQNLELNSDRNDAVSPMNQLLCTLRYFATGSQLTACGDIIGIHESTACRILHRVTHAIASLYSKYIKMPTTEAEQKATILKLLLCICGFYNNKLLLGDSGYAQTKYMMTPLLENTSINRAEKLYQESHIRTRNVIERAFGIWKRRFPILSKGINVKLCRVPGIIIATAVLHNIALLQNDVLPSGENNIHCNEEAVADDTSTSNGNHSGNLDRRLLISNYFARL